jgi:hypothetical protein
MPKVSKQDDSQHSTAGRMLPPPPVPVPPGVDLQCLPGVRAVASLGVVIFHSYIYWQFFQSHETKYELTRSNPFFRQALPSPPRGR